LSATGNGTGNEEKGEIPLTSVAGVNAMPATSTTAFGNDTVNNESVADLADNFQKVLRSKEEGLSPELKNQSKFKFKFNLRRRVQPAWRRT
jgi:hypothetical protein